MNRRSAAFMSLSLATHGYLRRPGDQVDECRPDATPSNLDPVDPRGSSELSEGVTRLGTDGKTGDSEGRSSAREMDSDRQVSR